MEREAEPPLNPPKPTPINIDRIFRVPYFIAVKNKGMYGPKLVPIGPYHHNKKQFSPVVDHKLNFRKDFLGRNKQVNWDTYKNTIHHLKDRARAWYSEKVFPDDEFVEVLLLDGCFILELLLKLEENKRHISIWEGWDYMAILSDLLLIENQIPFFVLEELYTTFKGLNENKTQQAQPDLKMLVVNNLFVKYLGDIMHSTWVRGPWNDKINHLLHLFHEVSLPNPKNIVVGNTNANTVNIRNDHSLPLIIPSVTQLLQFGFVLRKQDSYNNSDAMFKNSTLKIPRFIINSAIETILMNLLAFEQGLEESKSKWTGLIVMLSCLIKNKDDLEVLRSRGIIINMLQSEDHAVEFIRQLSERIIFNFSDHYYSGLFVKINLRCEAYIDKQLGRSWFTNEFVNNRWAVISFCTSVAAIILSTVQFLVSVFAYRHNFH